MSAPAPDSVAVWLAQLRAGDRSAVVPLWDRYFAPLLRRAERRLPPAGDYDGEDAAQSAFKSFWHAVARGHFPDLANRRELWAVLVTLLDRKIVDRLRARGTLKRGGAATRDADADLTNQPDDTPDPLAAAIAEDEFRRLLGLLDDDELRQIAVWKLEGYSHDEIAVKIDRVPRTVVNKVNLIRKAWERELPP